MQTMIATPAKATPHRSSSQTTGPSEGLSAGSESRMAWSAHMNCPPLGRVMKRSARPMRGATFTALEFRELAFRHHLHVVCPVFQRSHHCPWGQQPQRGDNAKRVAQAEFRHAPAEQGGAEREG